MPVLAGIGPRYRFDICGPFPARLQGGSRNRAPTLVDDIPSPIRKCACFIRMIEIDESHVQHAPFACNLRLNTTPALSQCRFAISALSRSGYPIPVAGKRKGPVE